MMEEVRQPATIQNIKVECIANSTTFSDKRSIVNEVTQSGDSIDDREIPLHSNDTMDLSKADSSQNNTEFLEEKLDSAGAVETEEFGDNSSSNRQPSNVNGLGIPSGNNYLRNAILDEVLSEKKMALLWSPQVIKFLQDQQMAKRSNF